MTKVKTEVKTLIQSAEENKHVQQRNFYCHHENSMDRNPVRVANGVRVANARKHCGCLMLEANAGNTASAI